MAEKKPLDEPVETPDHDLPMTEPQPAEDDWSPDASVPAAEAARALSEAEDRFLRMAAEYDNYRKRTHREKTEAFDRGAAAIALRLLDVLDDIDRLAESHPEPDDAFQSAFLLIQRKLWKELQGAGLEQIDAVGKPFDPTQHEAVSVVAPEGPEQDHLVKAVFQTGYRFKGTVIRPARVQVYSEQGTA
jgi:molecular chaperone GrpE